MLGVDVDFVPLPAEPATSHLFGAARGLVMFVLALALAVLGRRAHLPAWSTVAVAAATTASFAAWWATGMARSVRSHTAWFVVQCALVGASGLTMFVATR